MPKISVIMSVLNGNIDHLTDAVDSILEQTYDDFEFIIVNDGSQKYVTDYLGSIRDERVHIIDNVTNIGLTKSLNVALSQAVGEYVARMDADDIALPDRLYKQFTFLQAHSDHVMCGSMFYELVDGVRIPQRLRFFSSDEQIRKNIIWNNPFCHSSIMFRRSVCKKIGGYDEQYRYSQDYALWLKMVAIGKVCNLPEPLVVRRMEDNISTKREKQQKLISAKIRYDAIRRGDFSWFFIVTIIRPVIVAFMPPFVKVVFRWLKYDLSMRKM